jgi:hypothetical protein
VKHDEVPAGKLDGEHLDRDAAAVRPEKENPIRSAEHRVRLIDRVPALLDDVPRSVLINAVTKS